jgi:hypothetical protein
MAASEIGASLRRSDYSSIIFEMDDATACEGASMRRSRPTGPASNVCKQTSRRYGVKVTAAIEEVSGQDEPLDHGFVGALPDGTSKSAGFMGVQGFTPCGASIAPGREFDYIPPQSSSQPYGYVAAQPTPGR